MALGGRPAGGPACVGRVLSGCEAMAGRPPAAAQRLRVARHRALRREPGLQRLRSAPRRSRPLAGNAAGAVAAWPGLLPLSTTCDWPVKMMVSPLSRMRKPCAPDIARRARGPGPGRGPRRCCRLDRHGRVPVTNRVPFWWVKRDVAEQIEQLRLRLVDPGRGGQHHLGAAMHDHDRRAAVRATSGRCGSGPGGRPRRSRRTAGSADRSRHSAGRASCSSRASRRSIAGRTEAHAVHERAEPRPRRDQQQHGDPDRRQHPLEQGDAAAVAVARPGTGRAAAILPAPRRSDGRARFGLLFERHHRAAVTRPRRAGSRACAGSRPAAPSSSTTNSEVIAVRFISPSASAASAAAAIVFGVRCMISATVRAQQRIAHVPAQIAIGHDADQPPVAVAGADAAEALRGHHQDRLGHRRRGRDQRNRRRRHA